MLVFSCLLEDTFTVHLMYNICIYSDTLFLERLTVSVKWKIKQDIKVTLEAFLDGQTQKQKTKKRQIGPFFLRVLKYFGLCLPASFHHKNKKIFKINLENLNKAFNHSGFAFILSQGNYFSTILPFQNLYFYSLLCWFI